MLNKNTIIAFLIILGSYFFFTSEFYYSKILKKPYPSTQVEKTNKEDNKKINDIDVDSIQTIDIKKDSIRKIDNNLELSEQNVDSINTDSIKQSLDTILLENNNLKVLISENGGKIISIKTKNYQYNDYDNSNKNIELVKNSTVGGANLKIDNKNYDNKVFKLKSNDNGIFIFESLDGIKKIYSLNDNSYQINFNIESNDLIGKNINTGWYCDINESEEDKDGKNARYNRKKIHYQIGTRGEHHEINKAKVIEDNGYAKWAALTEKYFSIAFVQNNVKDIGIKFNTEETKKVNKVQYFKSDMDLEIVSDTSSISFTIYAGPIKIDELKKLDVGLEKILFGVSTGFGKAFATVFIGGKVWFPKICEFVLWLLIKLQSVVKDYGIVIIILTIILRVVTFPLTQSSMKSMNQMKEFQPKITKIREKYKSNPQKMNQKLMEFYKEEGVNPLAGAGGCLPMVLQMPIMISLFVVLRKSIELRGQSTFLIPWVSDLSKAEVLFNLPFNIDIPLYGSTFALFPVIFALLMYFQQKDQIKDPNQKAMIYMMPAMMLVMFNNFPAGLNLYFTFSTALQFIQQKFTAKKK